MPILCRQFSMQGVRPIWALCEEPTACDLLSNPACILRHSAQTLTPCEPKVTAVHEKCPDYGLSGRRSSCTPCTSLASNQSSLRKSPLGVAFKKRKKIYYVLHCKRVGSEECPSLSRLMASWAPGAGLRRNGLTLVIWPHCLKKCMHGEIAEGRHLFGCWEL